MLQYANGPYGIMWNVWDSQISTSAIEIYVES